MNAKENEGSYVFLLRLWPQEEYGTADGTAKATANSTANGRVDTRWCGRVQHVMSGEAHNFQDWSGLVDLLLTMMPVPDAAQQQETAD
jgi:hypothetical protein